MAMRPWSVCQQGHQCGVRLSKYDTSVTLPLWFFAFLILEW